MRIKIINPNTSQGMTERIAEAARLVASPGTEILAWCPSSGAPSIEGHYDEAMSVPGLLEAVRKGEAEGIDGYVIACFGDPGLQAAREIARGPVLGIAEAAMHVASMVAPSFSVVTTLARTRGIAAELAERYGMKRFCVGIRASEVAVLELEDPTSNASERVLAECRRAVLEDEAEAIVLGCAGMTDLCKGISAALGVPVVDGVAAAVTLVESVVRLGLGTSKRGGWAYPLPKIYSGDMVAFST